MSFVFRFFCFLLIGIFSCSASTLSITTVMSPSLEDVLEDVYSLDAKNNNVTTAEGDISLSDRRTLKKEESSEVYSTSPSVHSVEEEETMVVQESVVQQTQSLSNQEQEVKKAVPRAALKDLEGGSNTSTQELSLNNTPISKNISNSKVVLEDLIEIENRKNCSIPAEIPLSIQSDFKKATKDIPCELLQSLRTVEIFDDPEGVFPRAMANGRILKIRRDAISQPEFVQVLIHELGHVVDLGGLRSSKFAKKSPYKDGNTIIYADDLSVLFYKISWETEYQKKREMTRLDFVGGYAAQNMFEDYSESFLMYIEHGNTFQMLASKNPVLQKKYNFFRDHVFGGEEFFTGSYKVDHEKRLWDITKM